MWELKTWSGDIAFFFGGVLISTGKPTLRKQVLEWRFRSLQEILHNVLERPEVSEGLTHRPEEKSPALQWDWLVAVKIFTHFPKGLWGLKVGLCQRITQKTDSG